MLDRAGLGAGVHLDHIIGHEVTPAVSMGEAAARAVAVPWGGLQRQQIVAEIQMDGHAFPIRPF